MSEQRRRAVLLDRDGTIICERNYLSGPEQVELLPRVAEGLRKMQRLGLSLVVVTNQSGVGRGMFGMRAVDAVHDRLRELLRSEGVELDAIYVCPHSPDDNCSCRKPGIAVAEQAAHDLHFDLRESFVIGDKSSDMEFGKAIGAQSIPVGVGADLVEAADLIERAIC